jgi:hypothetical protein
MDMKLEIRPPEVGSFLKSKRKEVWNILFDVLKEQRENTVYSEPKQTNTVPFLHE